VYQAEPVDGFRLAFERAGRGPAVLLLHGWPGDRTDYRDDPLFPRAWSDRIGEFFAEASLVYLDGAGHFTPREAAGRFAAAVLEAVRSGPR
jgi:pimeloyl-ACP methyl ester carboxylesterase